MKNGTRLPVNARYGYVKGKDGNLVVDPEPAKVVREIFQMAADGMSFADITRELNQAGVATCDEQKESRGEQNNFIRFETIRKKRWSSSTVAGIIRDEIYIGTRIWGKTRCNMHTGYKAVLNDESDWIRVENYNEAIVERELFEKANAMHPKKPRGTSETRTNHLLERRKKRPALLICAHCGHALTRDSAHLLKCSDGRTSADPICQSLVVRREPMEEHILGLVRQFAASMLETRKKARSNGSDNEPEIDTEELQKQIRRLTSEKLRLYDAYKDGRIDREQYMRKADSMSSTMEEVRRRMEDAEKNARTPERKSVEDDLHPEEFLQMEKFDAEKLREIIRVVRVYSQDEIEIVWNFDDVFFGQR